MNNESHHPSAEFIGLASPVEVKAFKEQLRDSMVYLRENLKKVRDESSMGLAYDLERTLGEVIKTYRVNCRLLQTVVEELHQGKISDEKAETIFQTLPVIVHRLLAPASGKTHEFLRRARQWLEKQNPAYPELMVLVYVDSIYAIATCDHLAWASLNRNQIPHLRWNHNRVAEPWAQNGSDGEAAARTPAIQLTLSQHRGLELLKEIYAFHRQRKSVAGISIQSRPLLIGPSGSGKTSLVNYFAAQMGLPLLDLNSATWIVSGATSSRTSLRLIRSFIASHEQGIIYIDELDKFSATTDWMKNVQQECMALIDQRTGSFEGWSDADRARLERFFIIGAGTWQNLYYEDSLVLGFDLAEEVDLSNKLTEQKQIPDEILFRFPHLIELKGLSSGDFKQRIIQIRGELKLPGLTKDGLASLAAEAVKSRRQNRWLEQYVVHALRETSYPQ